LPEPAASARADALPSDALLEQTRALAAPIGDAQEAIISLLCFRLGEERFGLPAESVERTFAQVPVRTVPHRRHPAFRGLVAHEGEILLMASLERLLDLPSSEERSPEHARVVVLGPAGRGWAFDVDAIEGVIQARAGELRAAPATVTRGRGSAARSLLVRDQQAWTVLDPQALRNGLEDCAR
jgi:chemotaxis-related protein WspD